MIEALRAQIEGIAPVDEREAASIAYRSVVVVGEAHEVVEVEEKQRLLDLFVDRVLPGRAREARPMSEAEQRLTMMVAVQIKEASAKVSMGETDDDLDDQALPIWAGTIPARLVFDDPVADTRGAMANGDVKLPASVRMFLEGQ